MEKNTKNPSKNDFLNLLKKAVMPVIVKPETSATPSSDNYNGKQIRSSKTANTSLKQRGESQK
jgi:hypothetical protein